MLPFGPVKLTMSSDTSKLSGSISRSNVNVTYSNGGMIVPEGECDRMRGAVMVNAAAERAVMVPVASGHAAIMSAVQVWGAGVV